MPGTQQRGSGVPSGNALLQRITNLETMLGVQGATGQAFFPVRDANGVQRVRVGYLPNGDYGLWVSDTLGNVQEFLPTVTSFYASQLSTSSTTPATLANAPSVSVIIGANGDAIIEMGSNISASGAGIGGLVYPMLDGSLTSVAGNQWLLYNLNQSNATCYAAVLASQFFGSKLTPGKHTFTQQYSVHAAGTALFTANVIKVTPI